MNLDVLICLPENLVAPLAGAWIEIVVKIAVELSPNVAPLAGAWIEIKMLDPVSSHTGSLPSRERGLKLHVQADKRMRE